MPNTVVVLTNKSYLTIIYENIYEGYEMYQISISEIQRNLHHLDNFDIIEVIDKKRNKTKGYFIESKYASFVEELSQKVENSNQKQPSLKGILHRYADESKIQAEDGAWKQHISKKYSKHD